MPRRALARWRLGRRAAARRRRSRRGRRALRAARRRARSADAYARASSRLGRRDPGGRHDRRHRCSTSAAGGGAARRSSRTCSAEVPGIVSVGELRYVWQAGVAGNELCGCGLPVRRVPVLAAVGAGGVRRLGQGRRGRGAGARGRGPAPPQRPAARAAAARSRTTPQRLRRYGELTDAALPRRSRGRRGARSSSTRPRTRPTPTSCGRVSGRRPAGRAPRARQPRRRALVDEEDGAARDHRRRRALPGVQPALGRRPLDGVQPRVRAPARAAAPRPPGCATSRWRQTRSGELERDVRPARRGRRRTTWPLLARRRWRWPPPSTASAAIRCASRTAARSCGSTTPGAPA